jgi:transposase-like protein
MGVKRVKIDEPEKLNEFLQEVVSYSADFRAMVLKLVESGQTVEQVAGFASISEAVVYEWIKEWNQKKSRFDQQAGERRRGQAKAYQRAAGAIPS